MAVHALPRDERLQCDRRSEALLGETLAAFSGFDSARLDPTEWKFLARRDQFTVHRAVSCVDSHMRRVIASGFLAASLHDVLGGLYVEDDRELLTTQAILSPSGNTAVDAAVLLIAERREPRAAPFRFAGVKWYSWKRNLSAGEGQECDLLTYERMGQAVTDGRETDSSHELMYHVILSLNKPEWPLDVARGPGFRRADMAFCFLYRKVCDDLAGCFTLLDYDCRTAGSSRRAADTEMADRVLMVTRLPDLARAKVLSGFVLKAKGRPVLMSKTCLRCGSRRKVMEPLRNCSVCKKSVCHKCLEMKVIFSINSRTHEPETDAFCNKCLARVEALTAKKNAQRNSLTSASGDSSTGGSTKDKDRETHSGGSSGSSSRSGFKFWKKNKREPSPRPEKERRRHSLPATMSDRGPHTPNYDGLFRNYDVFGRASDNPRRQHFHLDDVEEQEPDQEQESVDPHYDGMYENYDVPDRAGNNPRSRQFDPNKLEFMKNQESEKKQGNAEPQRETRWRQTTFLANPEAAAAEAAAAIRLSLPRQTVVVRERENTVAEVFPVAKTVLETEDMYAEDGEDSPHSEAERAHLLYLERRQRLDDQKDQTHLFRREALTTPLHSPVLPKTTSLRDDIGSADLMLKSRRKVGAPVGTVDKPEYGDRKPAALVSRRSGSGRGGRKVRSQDNEDTFRMDLYGRF
ncbi:hypothetical protein PR001_g3225 [Phytophthora rubi]|uniref:FYVE-type domain-containing protein n=1 Tax=Phytophthora rubi TaxID=129364 RepID=A0A6A3P6G2_9STRA|nr:hypothetical protein PR001_g3225 [Phytophthora rubi]